MTEQRWGNGVVAIGPSVHGVAKRDDIGTRQGGTCRGLASTNELRIEADLPLPLTGFRIKANLRFRFARGSSRAAVSIAAIASSRAASDPKLSSTVPTAAPPAEPQHQPPPPASSDGEPQGA